MNRLTGHNVPGPKCLSLDGLWFMMSVSDLMPHPTKVSTNRFLDVMTVKCQSPLKGNSPIPLMLTNFLCTFSHRGRKPGQARPGTCMYQWWIPR